MAKVKGKPGGYANRTPWPDAIREVPAAWLEDAARRSPSPTSLLSAWKAPSGGVPAHVMLAMLRRRVREQYPELVHTIPVAAALHRAQEMLREIWTMAGDAAERHPTWQLVEGVMQMAGERLAASRADRDTQA